MSRRTFLPGLPHVDIVYSKWRIQFTLYREIKSLISCKITKIYNKNSSFLMICKVISYKYNVKA